MTDLGPTRIFYGWWIVAAAFLNLFFGVGIIFYGFPVLYPALVESLGFTRAQVTQGFLLGFLLVGLPFGFLAGALIDRVGRSRGDPRGNRLRRGVSAAHGDDDEALAVRAALRHRSRRLRARRAHRQSSARRSLVSSCVAGAPWVTRISASDLAACRPDARQFSAASLRLAACHRDRRTAHPGGALPDRDLDHALDSGRPGASAGRDADRPATEGHAASVSPAARVRAAITHRQISGSSSQGPPW